MGLGKLVKKITKVADPLGIDPSSMVSDKLFGGNNSFGGSLKKAAAAAAAQVAAAPEPEKGTAVEHKASTQAGGLRDITREAVKQEAGGSLDRFYPDYLKKSG